MFVLVRLMNFGVVMHTNSDTMVSPPAIAESMKQYKCASRSSKKGKAITLSMISNLSVAICRHLDWGSAPKLAIYGSIVGMM